VCERWKQYFADVIARPDMLTGEIGLGYQNVKIVQAAGVKGTVAVYIYIYHGHKYICCEGGLFID